MPYYPNREKECWLECGCLADWWGAIHKIGDRKSGKPVWTQYCKTHEDWLEIVEDKIGYNIGPPKRVLARARKLGYITGNTLF